MRRETIQSMPMRGVLYGLLASVLFGLTTPVSKGLLHEISPLLLAGLFYLGSGLGLSIYRLLARLQKGEINPQQPLRKGDWRFLSGAIIVGGVISPVLLMVGLTTTPASTASLFLNLEGVFTAMLAWWVFKEHYHARIFWGMVAIVAGGAILSLDTGSGSHFAPAPGAVLICGACLGWALDNNLTRKVSSADPTQIACYKGLVAGLINTALALITGSSVPGVAQMLVAMTVGFLGYGVSLVLYILALRHIGAARTGAYFAVAPFLGAMVSVIVFREPVTIQLVAAGTLMALGLWLHLTEHHSHEHVHGETEHAHEHIHDEHHLHEHGPDDPPGEPHTHVHQHERLEHDHPHFPDEHHFHSH